MERRQTNIGNEKGDLVRDQLSKLLSNKHYLNTSSGTNHNPAKPVQFASSTCQHHIVINTCGAKSRVVTKC